MFERTLRILFVLVAVVSLLWAAVSSLTILDRFLFFRTTGTVGTTLFYHEQEDVLTFMQVRDSDFPDGPTPEVGDTLLAFEGDRVDVGALFGTFRRPFPADTSWSMRFRDSEGELHETEMQASPADRQSLLAQASIISAYLLSAWILLIFGVITWWQRRGDPAARAFFLFLAGFAIALCISPLQMIPDSYARLHLHRFFDLLSRPALVISGLSYGAWLHFTLLFPEPLPIVRRRPWVAWTVSYLILLPGLAQALVMGQKYFFELLADPGPLYLSTFVVGTLQFFGGVIVLWRRRRRATQALHRRQLGVISVGIGLAMLLLTLPLIAVIAYGQRLFMHPTLLVVLLVTTIVAVLLLPVTFFVAFRRYRLLEIEWGLRRSTRYALVVGTLLVLIFAAIYGLATLLLGGLGIESPTGALATGIVLALASAPLLRRLQQGLENRLLPSRRRLREGIEAFLASTSSFPDRATLWERVERELPERLGIGGIVPLLRAAGQERFITPEGEPTPVALANTLMERLAKRWQPLLADEVSELGTATDPGSEENWLREKGITLLLPMVTGGGLIGLLGLQLDRDTERTAARYLGVLLQLAGRVALEAENLRLLEENLGKQRLEQQLAVARRVQEGLLPRQMPPTPGLQVAARSLFCYEIAGDYYDVIPLPGDRTALAIADVSGKGAGAALLMANLQASLRTALELRDDLPATVADINRIIHRNTSPEEYITFFVARFDPASGELEYVNAGHNRPRLLRADGSAEELATGGAILGAFDGLNYEAGRVMLRAGDLLAAFTDGVSEAMDEEEAEYGEERLVDLIAGRAGQPLEAVLDTVQAEINEFTGGEPLEDDFTLLLVRAASD